MNPLAGIALLMLLQRMTAQRTPAPAPAPAPRPTPPTIGPHFAELPTDRPLALDVGTTYAAQLELGALAMFASDDAIKRVLEQDGAFVLISSSEQRPSFWPSDDAADRYVVASYTGPAGTERALPDVVKRLWMAVAAPSSSSSASTTSTPGARSTRTGRSTRPRRR